MADLTQIRQELAIYAEANNIPEPAVALLDKLIENNVSYIDADKFCAEHFISNAIADQYKNFYEYIENLRKNKVEEPVVQQDDSLEIINQIYGLLDKLARRLQ